MRFIFLLVTVLTSCMETMEKPMKYHRFGAEYSCTAKYEQEEITAIICFTESGDTILAEYFDISNSTGTSKLFYDSGELKQLGTYFNNEVCGVWKEFYKDGNLKSYKFYSCEKDTTLLFYEKHFSETGALDSMMLPIEYRAIDSDSLFAIGTTYDLYIDLLYSEYDTVNSMLLIDSSPESNVKADTVFYTGRSGYVKFTPQKVGKHSITGTYLEVDGRANEPDEDKVAEKPFRFDYEAVETMDRSTNNNFR